MTNSDALGAHELMLVHLWTFEHFHSLEKLHLLVVVKIKRVLQR
jgi:hypothetical protein